MKRGLQVKEGSFKLIELAKSKSGQIVKQHVTHSRNSSMDLGPGVDTTRDETSRTQKTLPDKTKKKVTIEEAGSSFRLVEVMHTFDFFHI